MAKVGRPTKYNQEILDKTLYYINNYNELSDLVPSVESLALYLDIVKSTIYDWVNKYPEFSDAIEKLNQAQVKALIRGGLSGSYNATIAKVLLAHKGYSDKIDSTISGPNGKPIEQTWTIKVVEPGSDGDDE